MQGNTNKTAQFLDEVCKRVKCKIMHNDIKAEIASHIIEVKQHFMDDDKTDEEAENLAIAQMGNPEEIGLKLNKIHRPKPEWSIMILALSLFIIGIVTFSSYVVVSYPFFNSLLKVVAERDLIFAMIGIAAFFVIYFCDLKRMIKISFPVFIISTILLMITGAYFRIINDFYSPLKIYAIIIAVIMVSFYGSIYTYRNNFKAILLHFIPILFIVSTLVLSGGAVWAMILTITFPFIIILTLKSNHLKSRIKLADYIISSVLMAGNASLFVYSILNDIPRITNYTAASFAELQHSKFVGHATIDYNVFRDGFSFSTIIRDFGILFTLIAIVTLIAFLVRITISSVNIKDVFYRNTALSVCITFISEVFIGFLNEIGIYLSGETHQNCIFPFLSQDIPNYLFNLILLAVLLSCFRRKNITPSIEVQM